MANYSLVITPTVGVAGCIISIRPTYSCAVHLLIYLLTQFARGVGPIKPSISPKWLKIERKLLLTAYIKSYTDFRFLPKCMTLNDLYARFKIIDSLKAAKNGEIQLSNDSNAMQSGWMHYIC